MAVLPSYANPVAQMFRIRTLPLVEPSIRRESSFLTRRGLALSPAASGFRDFLKTYVRDWESWHSAARAKPARTGSRTWP